MRVLPIILSVVALAGCATNQSTNLPSIPTPKPSMPKPNVEPGDTSILGVVLNKPFGGFPECKLERDILDKYKFNYVLFPEKPCYKRFGNKVGSLTPVLTEKIYVDWSVRNDSMPFYIQGLKIELVDGIVHEIDAPTRGLTYQAQIANDLTSKFGKPKTTDTKVAQNKMGAKFDVKYLTWSLPNKTSIMFAGALGNIESGYILLSTENMMKIKQQQNEEKEAKRPKL